MSGHGSPTARSRMRPPFWRAAFGSPLRLTGFAAMARYPWALAIVAALLLASASCQTAEAQTLLQPANTAASNLAPAETINLRLRISLGGGSPRQWQGQISIDDDAGAMSNFAPLGLNENANAAIQLRKRVIQIDHRFDTDYNAVDVTIAGKATTNLHIQLSPADAPDEQVDYVVPLVSLSQTSHSREIDNQGNRCSIERAPGDQLRVQIDRSHLIFRPNEAIEFQLNPNQLGLPDSPLQCLFELTPARRTKGSVVLWRKYVSLAKDENGQPAPVDMTVLAPRKEGVYDLTIEVKPTRFADGFRSSFTKEAPAIRRTVQLVVLAEEPPATDSKTQRQENWQPFVEFSPAQLLDSRQSLWPKMFADSIQRLKPGNWAGGNGGRCLGNNRRELVEQQDQTLLSLQTGGWQAVPIVVPRRKGVCVIEVDYLASEEIALGISLMKPDAAGQISPLGQDSGPFRQRGVVPMPTNQDSEKSPSNIRTHRLYHWPTDEAAWLVIANRHANQAANISAIRVLTGPSRLPAAEPQSTATAPTFERRQLMAFYEAPLFPENFGASEFVEPVVGQPLDDWVTFYEGADRLVQYLKSQSLAGAFVTVAADGSGIYPSELLQPGPRYDNGSFWARGNDPLRKDVVELLFRMFEREGLTLVPVLALSGPLPALESQSSGETGVAPLVDYSQRLSSPGSETTLPRYNPLNPNVQQATVDIVDELTHRYRQYQSFTGVAIACRPNTYTLLPGQQWACDPATVQRFLDQVEHSPSTVAIKALPSHEQITQLLGSHRDAWLAWRADQMATWYRRLRDTVTQSLPAGKLYLAPIDLYRNAEISAALNPALHTSGDMNDIMLRLGFDASWQSDDPLNAGITLLNPARLATGQSLASRRVDQHVASWEQSVNFFREQPRRGDLLVHHNTWTHFAQLQAEPPFAAQTSPLMRLQQLTPAGDAARRRFAQRLRDTDTRLLIDGGRMLPVGQEEAWREFREVFTQLPAVDFEDVQAIGWNNSNPVASDSLPVIVRQANAGSQNWFYAVNASPWPVKVRCDVGPGQVTPDDQPFESLSSTAFTYDTANETARAEVTLAPWSIAGGRARDGDTRLRSYAVQLPDDADIALRKEIYRLQSLLVQSSQTKPLEGLANAGFETVTPEAAAFNTPAVTNWQSGPDADNTQHIRLESQDVHEGAQALKLNNEINSPVWLRSNEFVAPQTGRLSVSAWLKTDQPDQPLPLRIALEGKTGETSYYRFGSIGSLSPNPDENQVGSEWRRFAVHFDDLPLENLDRLRIGFDLMGPGSVTIDQVEIYDRWLDENDAKAMTQLLASASTLLSTPETLDRCRRLLGSYWLRFLSEHFQDASTQPPPLTAAKAAPPESPQPPEREVTEQPTPRQGMLRFRNVFGPRKPTVR